LLATWQTLVVILAAQALGRPGPAHETNRHFPDIGHVRVFAMTLIIAVPWTSLKWLLIPQRQIRAYRKDRQ